MVDKNAILNCLGDMCVKDIVMMILRGTFSFDEIKESGRLDDEKLELVALALSKAMEEKRHFEAELRRLEERAGKLLAAMKKLEGDHLTCPPLDFYESLVDARKSIIGDTHRLKEEIRYSEFCNDDELFPTVLVIESSLNSVGLVLPDLNCYCVLESGDHDDELFCLDPDDEKVLSPSIPRPEESKDLEDPMGLQKFPLPKTWRFWRRKAGSVYSALYAPAAAGVDKWFKVQVHLYGKSDAKRVNKKALAMDGNATLNESNPLSINIERGTKVEAEIHVYDDGVRVNTMKQSLVWNGEMVSTVFQVKANKSTLKSVAGDVTLSVKGFPVGRLSFNTEITQSPTDESTFVLGKAKSYKKAFISYSHVDIKSAEMAASFLKAWVWIISSTGRAWPPVLSSTKKSSGTSENPICSSCSGPRMRRRANMWRKSISMRFLLPIRRNLEKRRRWNSFPISSNLTPTPPKNSRASTTSPRCILTDIPWKQAKQPFSNT